MKINDNINVHNSYEELSELCMDGSPMKVIAALKATGFDRRVMVEKLEFDKDSIWYHTVPGVTPVESACRGDNARVFRLLLELGLTPHTKCCADTKYPTFPDYVYMWQAFGIIEFLNNAIPGWNRKSASVSPWWSYKYTPQRNSDLQITMEKQIMRGDLIKVLWLGLRGGRLLRPDILASKGFEEASPLMRKLVWLLLVPDDARRDYQQWLQQNSPNTINLLPHKKPKAAAKGIFRNFLLSWGLFPNPDMLIEALTDNDKILLLQYLSEEVHPRGRNWKFARELHPILCNDILLNS